jgi:hypothetical protein
MFLAFDKFILDTEGSILPIQKAPADQRVQCGAATALEEKIAARRALDKFGLTVCQYPSTWPRNTNCLELVLDLVP